ncbi:MAG: hypothetical protein ACK532_06855 [Acidobacteriota bacterium]
MLWEPFGHVCNSFPCNTFAKRVVTGLGRFRIPERNVRVPFGDKIAAAIPRRFLLQSLATPAALSQTSAGRGTVTKNSFRSEKHHPGTVRDYWVNTPAAAPPATGYALMVFQDGAGFINETGRFKAAAVF